MPTTRRVVYWDSCVWIAWLMDEPRDQDEMDGIAECVEMVESGKWVILSSVEIYKEILTERVGQEARKLLDEVCKRPQIQMAPLDFPWSARLS